MKNIKRICLALFIMLFTATSAFASESAFNEFKKIADNEMYSGTITYSFDNKLLKSLDFMSDLQAEINKDGVYYSPFGSMFDYKSVAESLFDAKYNASITYSLSKDYKKFEASYEVTCNAPVTVNKNFKNTSEFVTRMWIKYDLSNAEKPYYDVIYEYPFMGKYMHISSDNMNDDNTYNDLTECFVNSDFIKEYRNSLFDIIKNTAAVERSGNKFTVKITDGGFKEILNGTVKIYTAKFKEYYEKNAASEDLNNFKTFMSDAKVLANEIMHVPFIGSDGITVTIDTDGRKVNSVNVAADVDTNVKKIADAVDTAITKLNVKGEKAENYTGLFDGVETDIEDPFKVITEQNSDIKCKINVKYEYKDFNKKVKIIYPKLDGTNTFDFSANDPDFGYTNYDENDYASIDVDKAPYAVDGTIYIPLKPLLNECGIEPDNITYTQNGSAAAIAAIGNTNSKFNFGMAVFNIGVNSVVIDGEEYYLSAPVIETDGMTYVPSDFLYRFGGELTDMTCYGNNYTHYSIEFNEDNSDM